MVPVVEKLQLLCYHCGDACTDNHLKIQDKVFCCQGCKTVYEILNENALCDYYELGARPGNKVDARAEKEYAFLEEEAIKITLLNFSEGNISNITFHIPSIHCSSCIWLLENLHKIRPGVLSSTINFPKKQLDVQFDHTLISLKSLALLLDSLGYPPEITLNGKTVNNVSVNRTLLYKIGIAGFCFGNIMMLSIPEYVSFLNDLREEFKTFFSLLSLLLALPVFFYCASDYFTSAWSGIKNKIINIDLPIALGLVAAFGQSVYEIFSHTGPGYLDSLTGLVFFLLIGKWYQSKVYEALSFERDYKSYFPLAATLIKDEKESHIPIHELKPGDIILIRNQEVIPADAIIHDGDAHIDYSFVTGEAIPIHKKSGEPVFAGGKQAGTAIQVRVTKSVSESYLTQLWNKNQTKLQTTTGLTEFTNKVGVYFTVIVLCIGLLTYLYWSGTDNSRALYAAVSVLIIFCPCTLALAIPFCFSYAMNVLGKNGLFLKNAVTVEKLADNKVIVWDKTGTLTYAGKAEVEFHGTLAWNEQVWVKSLAGSSMHPLSRSIYDYWPEPVFLKPTAFKEYLSQGIQGVFDGHQLKIGSYAYVYSAPAIETDVRSRVYVQIDDEVKGWFTVKNKYRISLDQILRKMSTTYEMHLLSGDNASEKETLKPYFKESHMHFLQSPIDKSNYVKSLEESQHTLVIGDGLNDAGALMESHCGISVSEKNGNFSPACDAILSAEQLERLPDFLAYAKTCVRIVHYSLLVSLTYNITGLFFACQGILKPMVAAILMPLSSVSIVLFVIVLSNIYAKKYRLKEK